MPVYISLENEDDKQIWQYRPLRMWSPVSDCRVVKYLKSPVVKKKKKNVFYAYHHHWPSPIFFCFWANIGFTMMFYYLTFLSVPIFMWTTFTSWCIDGGNFWNIPKDFLTIRNKPGKKRQDNGNNYSITWILFFFFYYCCCCNSVQNNRNNRKLSPDAKSW